MVTNTTRIPFILFLSACLVLTCSFPSLAPLRALAEDATSDSAEPEFYSLSDPNLLSYVEESVVDSLEGQLDNGEYSIEGVEVRYLSREAIDDYVANSRETVFFGYTESQLENYFHEDRYVFYPGEDGTTQVRPFQPYEDVMGEVAKTVLIGAGVIVVLVTIAVVTGGAISPDVPATTKIINTIAVVGAKSANDFVTHSAAIGSVVVGGVEYARTGDIDKALSTASTGATKQSSKEFKVSAIVGTALRGGAEAVKIANAARGVTRVAGAVL